MYLDTRKLEVNFSQGPKPSLVRQLLDGIEFMSRKVKCSPVGWFVWRFWYLGIIIATFCKITFAEILQNYGVISRNQSFANYVVEITGNYVVEIML